MAETLTAEFNVETAKKSELIAKMQELNIEVNPSATNEALRASIRGASSGATISTGFGTPPIPVPAQGGELAQILGAITTLVGKVDTIDKRLNRVETGGIEDFKGQAKEADIASASETKEGINPRIVQIVENTLGIDFGVTVEGNKDNPGTNLTILVPQRLSPVVMSTRPIVDKVTGKYKLAPGSETVDPSTGKIVGAVMEEEFWPGDRRSVALGATDSYDVIQSHANRVRANILAWYQKLNRPNPEFKTR